MIFKFRLLSSEKDDFVRDFEARSDQTFYDLHKAIQKNCGYDPSQIASFFLCTNDWEKQTEITLFELSGELAKGILAMDASILSDYITGLKQRMLYIFDIFNERAFFIETAGIRDEDTSKSYPCCTLSEGSPPIQLLPDEMIPEKGLAGQWDDRATGNMNDPDADKIFNGNDEPVEE